jgi:hypothetical protein
MHLPEFRQKCVCVYYGNRLFVIGGCLSQKTKDGQYQFPEYDWVYNLETNKLKKINRISMGRIYFGVFLNSNNFLFVTGGLNSNNE